MKKESSFQADLDQIIDEFRENGADDQTINAIRKVSRVQRRFLPEASILGWLKEQVMKSRIGLTSRKERKGPF